MNSNRALTVADELPPDRVKAVIGEGVVILGLLGFITLGMLLPGAGREIGGTGIVVGDLVLGIGTLGIVATLLYAAPKLRRFAKASLEGPWRVVADVAAMLQYTLIFVAVVIAHQGFAPLVGSIIERVWAYDLAFLLFAVIPLGLIAYRFYRSVDPISDLLTAMVVGRHAEEAPHPSDETGR